MQSLLCIREKIEPLDYSMRDYDLRESTAMEALKQNLSGEKDNYEISDRAAKARK